LQDGHCPFHLGKSSPQAEQRNTILFFILVMRGRKIAFRDRGIQGRVLPVGPQ
jgi:hypothetical protein